MYSSLFKFTLPLNSVFLFWKLLVFEFVFAVSDTFLCSVFARKVKIALLLDPLQLSCWLYGRCRIWFLLILFCSDTFAVTKILIVFIVNFYIYASFPHCIMVGVIALIEFLLLYK
jgi:hypothetical protein